MSAIDPVTTLAPAPPFALVPSDENEPPALLDHYLPLPSSFDEMRAGDGSLRPHWQYLLESLRTLGPDNIAARSREARRLVRDNGVTYNIYGDPRGMSRPWELDPIPLLVRGEEWAELERGLIQRAELLNLILLDLHGPRQLVRKGLVPPELIDGFSGYLLPCVGTQVAENQPLVLYGADLTRDGEGRWHVLGDRAQSPSGAGYALENRVVLSRVLPSLFRDSHVHRLAGFFRAVRRALARLAPREPDEARIALMTPGPSNEAYFEHAYLANYLGYSLVQGGDLSVRDGALWLRTLGRLERIDALIRRVDDVWCDSLELREDSLLGVPGLLAAVRAGNLTVANALGSGVLEHPGLFGLLPGLCQHLLGEELLLPQTGTWWCGEPDNLERAIADLDRFTIKQTGGPIGGATGNIGGTKTWLPQQLAAPERDALIAAMRATPALFVAQDMVKPSTTPAYIDGRLQPRPFVLRSFLVADQEGYVVMPGGLSRVALNQSTPIVSHQLGGLGKDTWVLATEPERQETLIIAGERASPAIVHESEVSSRVADNLFWIGRYAERAEGLVRLLRVTLIKLGDRFIFQPEPNQSTCLRLLLQALTCQSQTYPGFVGEGAEERLAEPTEEMISLITDAERAGGLPQTLQALGTAAWSVRDRLSNDTWRVVNAVEKSRTALTKHQPQGLSGVLDVLDPLVTSLVAFAALTNENMNHNEGWHFLEAGRRIERGSDIAALLRATLVPVAGEPDETLTIEAVLGVTDSLITYRRRYRSGTRVGALLDLVFQDETNPRSLAFQLAKLQRLVYEMPRTQNQPQRSQAEKFIMRIVTDLRLAELDLLSQSSVTEEGEPPRREALDTMLSGIEDGLANLSDALTAQYFRHEEQPHYLLDARSGGLEPRDAGSHA
ncbi:MULTISPECIES: circularly permuted type 2 ATP-grasp protein [Thiorhodovibrio]|uniref:circularly permuted type 2 ATP-grasp protein n=1 Tax=Thiorhodovibrio TaxID=61593 RepID=UPI001913C652|nr:MULTISPECIES: circularly permuted type 2 ATP-grasp protein [Thiorhodovibrio]MBK5968342.1 hypothetical protein [Thiorhodovibrio winogradskyi]WPL13209.1 hypothetical protein Thiosp_03003 [Thiorhodovibrio litoralis]